MLNMNKNISYLIPLTLIIFGCSTEPKDTDYPESKKLILLKLFMDTKLEMTIDGLKILQAKNQRHGLKNKITILRALLEKINIRNPLQKI